LVEGTGRRKDVRVKAKLKVRFKDAKAFISEYTHNISKGGLFVRTKNPCETGATVEIVIVMPESGREISSRGEVIHAVAPDRATDSRPAGMGIQINEISEQDRKHIEDFIREHLKADEYADGLGRRSHPRIETRIRVKFGTMDALIEEYTHNISHGGIFIRTKKPKKLNDKLKIILSHPESGEEMILDGQVVRVVGDAEAKRTGHPPGMGIYFLSLDKYTKGQLKAFIKLSSSEKNTEVEIKKK
jgi:type IV pilus assembly protein PilZ